ncbi:ATP-dependent nuclease [Pantoea ananatis]|uniref:ATP-dependent nuclease n=1 Tax=Pantoea ananas TaxID=553 RepID=UPI003C22E45F
MAERYRLENTSRQQKNLCQEEQLTDINKGFETCQFGVRSGLQSRPEASPDIKEDGICVRNLGKGGLCFMKMEFALRRPEQYREPDAFCWKNRRITSVMNLKKLMNTLAPEGHMQRFVATHSSHISSRPDHRSAFFAGREPASGSAGAPRRYGTFFYQGPDINVPEFALARRGILVEGDAEFILTDAFYRNLTGRAPEDAGVHIVAIGGTSLCCYLELARIRGNRVAALRDNDGDCQRNCVEGFADMTSPERKVYGDEDASRSTFDICVYRDNTERCERVFAGTRRRLSVQEYMLASKAWDVFGFWRREHG